MRRLPFGRLMLATLLLAMLWPVTPAAAEEPPPQPVARLATPEIFGYLPYWALDATIDFGAITTIAYFGLGAGADGYLVRRTSTGSLTTEYSRWQSARVRGIIDQAHAAGVKFVLTVERMAWDDGSRAVTEALLSNPDARTTLVADVVNEITTRGLDGVSLDFEPILSTQRDNFAAFVRELRAGLDAVNPGYQLTFAATGSQRALTYDMFGALTSEGAADAVIIMGYPLRAIDAQYAGGLAPLYSPTSYDLAGIVDAYLADVAGDKVILALPWYGRQWPTLTDQVNSAVQTDRTLYWRAHNIGYAGALQYAIANGRQLDPVEQSAWTAYRWRYCADCPETWKQVYYDDVETLAYKYDWAASKGLAGIGIWALGYDNDQPEMWQLLRIKYRGLVDTTPPSGSFEPTAGDAQCDAPRVNLNFALDDGAGGSGPVYIRLSSKPDQSADGLLAQGRTYPSTGQLLWPMDDASTGGSATFGARKVYAQWRDVAGNWSAVSSTGVELVAPATADYTVAGAATLVSTATVPVAITHTGGRAIDAVKFSSSAATGGDRSLTYALEAVPGAFVDFSMIDPATGGSDVDGVHTVYGQWRDVAGCWSTPMSARITLDRGAPVGSLAIIDSPTYALAPSVQLVAPATDAVSGVAAVQLSNDSTNWTSLPPTDQPFDWSAGDHADGPWTISARWQDVVGNWSGVSATSVILDTHGPTGTLVVNGGAPFTPSDFVTISATAFDEGSDVTELLLSNSPAQVDGVLAEAALLAPGTIEAWALPGAGTVEGVADGRYIIYAQWRDAVGHWSNVVSAAVGVDRTAPTVSEPQAQLRKGGKLEPTTVPIDALWQAQDDLSGVAQELLEISQQGEGALPPGSSSASAAVSPAGIELERSAAWILRVSATDAAGNTSAPVEGTPFSAFVQEDSSTAVQFAGTWKTASNANASGGTTRYATARGATATWSFTGTSVAWVAQVGPQRGKARVFIDGVLTATVDLKAAANRSRGLVFTSHWAATATHTIKIKVLGTPGRPRVDVDALIALL